MGNTVGDGAMRPRVGAKDMAYCATPVPVTRLATDLANMEGVKGKVNGVTVWTVLGALGHWMRSHPSQAFGVCVVLYHFAGQRSEHFRGGRERERFSVAGRRAQRERAA